MADAMSVKDVWDDGVNARLVAGHYGYTSDELAPTRGFWRNDGTVLKKLSEVQELLEKFGDPEKKIRVVFDYDPNYPRALIQVWGLRSYSLE